MCNSEGLLKALPGRPAYHAIDANNYKSIVERVIGLLELVDLSLNPKELLDKLREFQEKKNMFTVYQVQLDVIDLQAREVGQGVKLNYSPSERYVGPGCLATDMNFLSL